MTARLQDCKTARLNRIAIQQSNYLPWKGYFDIIRSVDEFIIMDNVQYTRRDWRNRNLVKTKDGLKWLTIPVKVKGRYEQLIKDVEVTGGAWAARHWKVIKHSYGRCRFFGIYEDRFREAYSKVAEMKMLTDINMLFLVLLNSILGITTKITRAEDYSHSGSRNDRILSLCLSAGATEHLTGPSALSYLDRDLFRSKGLEISVADYSCYPEYTQLFPPFRHNVSIIDLIFNEGDNATGFMKRF